MKPLGWALTVSLSLHAVLLIFLPFPEPVPPSLVGGRRAVIVNLSAGSRTSKGGVNPANRSAQKPPSPENDRNHVPQKSTLSKPKTSCRLSPTHTKGTRPYAPSAPLKTATPKRIPKTKPIMPEHADEDRSLPMTSTAADLKLPVPQSPSSQVNPPANAVPVGAITDSADKIEENQSTAASPLENQYGAVDQGGVSGDTTIKAVPLYRLNPPPPYPRLARRKGFEGKVLMDVWVGEDGQVSDIKIAQSSGYGILDRAALKTVQTWRFEPARSGGKAIAMWVEVPIRFRIRSQ